MIKKVKNTVPWTCIISDLNEQEIVRTFFQKELQKTNQKKFRIEKVIQRKGNKLYIKWKGYNSLFNSYINKKDIVFISEYFPDPKFLWGKAKAELD